MVLSDTYNRKKNKEHSYTQYIYTLHTVHLTNTIHTVYTLLIVHTIQYIQYIQHKPHFTDQTSRKTHLAPIASNKRFNSQWSSRKSPLSTKRSKGKEQSNCVDRLISNLEIDSKPSTGVKGAPQSKPTTAGTTKTHTNDKTNTRRRQIRQTYDRTQRPQAG